MQLIRGSDHRAPVSDVGGLNRQTGRTGVGVTQEVRHERRHLGPGDVLGRPVGRRSMTQVGDTHMPQLDNCVVALIGHGARVNIGKVVGRAEVVDVRRCRTSSSGV